MVNAASKRASTIAERPVRIEHQWLGNDGPIKTVCDQFEWDPELPADTFIPEIPAGFTLEADSEN